MYQKTGPPRISGIHDEVRRPPLRVWTRRGFAPTLAGMDWLHSLRDLLKERLDAVADRDHYQRDPDGHLQRLQSVTTRLEESVQALPPDADPQLRHYLTRQSYVKAIDWLDQEITTP